MITRARHVLLLAGKLLLLPYSLDVGVSRLLEEKQNSPVLPSLSVLDVYLKSESSSRAYALTTYRDRHLGKRERSNGSPVLSPRCRFILFPFYPDWVTSSSSLLVTVISFVFAALQEDYPAARFPAICWLVLFIPLFGVSLLLYLCIRRANEHPIVARLWLVFAVGQACGVLSATCALVGKGDFQTPASLFDAFWSTCVTFALHSASCHSLLRSLH